MHTLTQFELWQAVNMTAQSVLLLATFLGALYVGIKQYEINRQLVELQHQPSVEVAVAENNNIHIHNRGSSSIWLWGSHVENSPKLIEKEPRLITPQGFFYIPLVDLKASVGQRIGRTGEERLALSLFIKTADKRNYIVRNVLRCVVVSGEVSVHSQTLAVDNEEWESNQTL